MNIHEDSLSAMGKRVAVELGTKIKLEFEGVEIPLQSSMIGLEHDNYIILKTPEPFQRIEHKIFPGSELIVRYLSSGTVYAFQTRIIATTLRNIDPRYPTVTADQRATFEEARRMLDAGS